jgi:predicted transcriptional regulator
VGSATTPDSDGGHTLAADLFTELASDLRCSMLMSLSNKPAKLSSLAREFDTTVQDVHRNANRLMETGLVRKNEDGAIHLTEYGRIVVKQVPYFVFMKNHAKFFAEHTLNDMPEKFVQRIGSLQNCELVRSVTSVMEKLKKLESSTQKQLRIMVSQAWAEEGRIIIELSMQGVQILTIVGRNTIFPKEIVESILKTIDKIPANQRKMEAKMVDKVHVALYIADENAAVMFPNKEGEIDMNALFIGNDPAFHEWCSDLFDHYWSRAGYFDVKKATLV